MKQKGFTLIELTVSIFILVILSTVVVANYRQGEKRRRAALVSDGIVNAVRLAQNYALSGKQIQATSCPNKSAQSYQISFDNSNSYVLYAEDNCSNPLFEVQRFTLLPQIQIRPSELKINGAQVTTLSLKFTLPYGQVTASGNGGAFASFTSANVGVETTDSSHFKVMTVDGVSGRIGE
jgi:prepilin-type N-terminal cleavage/methylation domain-containing protein